MAHVDNVKLPDLINKWIEVQKSNCSKVEANEPLEIDAVNLTLLLKALGFKLDNFDFDSESDALKNETVTIEIKCNKSGIKSSLTYNLVKCTCPEKTKMNEASFWEIQATGPKMSRFNSATYKDASSNLLPEVSDSCSHVAKAMLSNLLDYYQDNIKAVANERNLFKSPLKPISPSILVTSPGMTMRAPYSTPPAEGKCTTFVYPAIPQDNLEKTPEAPTINIDEPCKSDVKEDTINIEGPDLLAQVPPTILDFPASEPHINFVTSSPNERSNDVLQQNNERDMHVIQSLNNAHQQIQNALLFMKLNGKVNLPTQASSLLTNTPQPITKDKTTGTIPKLRERATTMTSIHVKKPTPTISNGRKSLGATVTPKTSLLRQTPSAPSVSKISTPSTLVKKKMTSSTNSIPASTKFIKSDTPRPILTRSKPISSSIPGLNIKKAPATIDRPKINDLKK